RLLRCALRLADPIAPGALWRDPRHPWMRVGRGRCRSGLLRRLAIAGADELLDHGDRLVAVPLRRAEQPADLPAAAVDHDRGRQARGAEFAPRARVRVVIDGEAGDAQL